MLRDAEIARDELFVASRQCAELLLICREVIVGEKPLPFLLDQQQPRIRRVDERAAAPVQAQKVEGYEERRNRHHGKHCHRDERENADRVLREQAENRKERRLDREEMREPLLLQRLVELEQIEIGFPLLQQSRVAPCHRSILISRGA